jgi:mRNA interferase RelE/StbE
MFQIKYFEEAKEDILNLPKEILIEVYSYLKKYETDPYKYGKRLYNRKNIKLEGYFATYVANATYRIVYYVDDGITKIVEVVAVGKRRDKQVYIEAHKRILQK